MIKGVLIDLSGTLHLGAEPIPGAAAAVERLARSGLAVRFATNTSRTTRSRLHIQLEEMGLALPVEQILTAPRALQTYLREKGLRPHLLVHPGLREEFADLPQNDPNAVVIGYAAEAFTYDSLNAAFRLLKEGAPLLATGKTRYFQGSAGLLLDAGPFVAALEYASGTEAQIFGKPAPAFFLRAVEELGCRPGETVMIGDDARSDVAGAVEAGLLGILVRTGKYRAGDEAVVEACGGRVAADIAAAVDLIVTDPEGGRAESQKS